MASVQPVSDHSPAANMSATSERDPSHCRRLITRDKAGSEYIMTLDRSTNEITLGSVHHGGNPAENFSSGGFYIGTEHGNPLMKRSADELTQDDFKTFWSLIIACTKLAASQSQGNSSVRKAVETDHQTHGEVLGSPEESQELATLSKD